MARIVRLTESDLTRIVRKVLQEESEDIKWPSEDSLKPLRGKIISFKYDSYEEFFKVIGTTAADGHVTLAMQEVDKTGTIIPSEGFSYAKRTCWQKKESKSSPNVQKTDINIILKGGISKLYNGMNPIQHKGLAQEIDRLYCSKGPSVSADIYGQIPPPSGNILTT